MSTTHRTEALLLSGGIGDYLHYLTRLDALLDAHRSQGRAAPTVFVESTVPRQVARVFALTCPDLTVEFVPAAIHWTKTNPLLVPDRAVDRENRPAHRYVMARNFGRVTDWFLPSFCGDHPSSLVRLQPLVSSRPPGEPYVVISAREKGFLWWPQEDLCRQVETLLRPVGRAVYLGTVNERLSYMTHFVEAQDVAEALSLSFHAELFIGTDTGTATMRELMGRTNVYCVNQFWIDELMVRYGYWSPEQERHSHGLLTRSADELLASCERLLGQHQARHRRTTV